MVVWCCRWGFDKKIRSIGIDSGVPKAHQKMVPKFKGNSQKFEKKTILQLLYNRCIVLEDVFGADLNRPASSIRHLK